MNELKRFRKLAGINEEEPNILPDENPLDDIPGIAIKIDDNNDMFVQINQRGENGLPIKPISSNQTSIAGGFFLLHRDKIQWWSDLYYKTLKLYFDNQRLVKDDQIIIADCAFSHLADFKLYQEATLFDGWFMFQRLLL